MNTEFNWWLLIVGLVVGAGLVWLVVADSRRREADVSEVERDAEAQWIAATMTDAGRGIDEADVLDVLRLHAAYLAAAPPDEVYDDLSEDGAVDEDSRWVAVPTSTGGPSDGGDRRSMAHPIRRAEPPDREGDPA